MWSYPLLSELHLATLVEAGGSGMAPSIPDPTASLPAPSQCHIALGAAQLLFVAAFCSWDSTTNTIYAIAAGFRQGTKWCFVTLSLTPSKTCLVVAGQDGCTWDKHRVQKGPGLPHTWLPPPFLLSVPP